MSDGRRAWSFHVGRIKRNRVTVYQVVGKREAHNILMEWHEGPKQFTRSLKHRDRSRAMAEAVEKAGELAKNRLTHQPPETLMAMRSDLVRCAHLQGMPAGSAPGYTFYEKHGRYRVDNICAAFKGWRGRLPRESWGTVLGRFKLRPVYAGRSPSPQQIMDDVRAVAHAVGQPRRMPTKGEYLRLGKWYPETVRKVLGLDWDRVADALGLTMEWWRREAASRVRADSESRSAAA